MASKTRKISLLLCLLAMTLSVLAGCGMVRVDPEKDKETIVAVVAGEEVKKAEFTQMFDIFKAQYEKQFGAEVWDKEMDGRKFGDVAKEKILEMLIDTRIQLKKADEMGIKVTDEEINTEIENAKKYFETEEKFNEFLKEQSMDLNYFKDSVRKDMIISKVREKLTVNVTVTDEEVKSYYDAHLNEFMQVKASHILLETKEEAQKLLDRVKAGENFNDLAKEFSKDPSAKDNGGDLGFFGHGDMVEPFEQAAFALKPGQISEIVETQYGFHIIKVEDSKIDKFEDIKEQLKNTQLNDKMNSEYEKMLEDMRSKANIQKFEKNL